MSDEAYITLRRFLDKFPLGFPETDSGVEIKILKRLFTEDQARLVIHLIPFLETSYQIAKRAGIEHEGLEDKLEIMASQGLIFRVRRGGWNFFRAAPFMIGLYEYSVKDVDQELALLYKEYYEAAYLDEMGISNVPGFKVLPIGENVIAETTLFPFLKLKESILKGKEKNI